MGVANVRAMFADHELHHADDSSVVFDVPAGFVRDWLSFHDRHDARCQTLWLATATVLAFRRRHIGSRCAADIAADQIYWPL